MMEKTERIERREGGVDTNFSFYVFGRKDRMFFFFFIS